MVAEAEKSRIEADKALREHRSDSKHMRSTMNEVEREIAQAKREMQQGLREAEQEVREALQESRQAQREAVQDARDAQRDAWEAEREARNSAKSAARISSISYTTSAKVNGPDCAAMNRQIAMGGGNGLAGQAWAVVAGCGGFEVKIDQAAILDTALLGLKKERAEAAKCKDSKVDRAQKIKDLDRSIAKVKAQLSMI
jgi:bla regulator protein BlaR1